MVAKIKAMSKNDLAVSLLIVLMTISIAASAASTLGPITPLSCGGLCSSPDGPAFECPGEPCSCQAGGAGFECQVGQPSE